MIKTIIILGIVLLSGCSTGVYHCHTDGFYAPGRLYSSMYGNCDSLDHLPGYNYYDYGNGNSNGHHGSSGNSNGHHGSSSNGSGHHE